MNDMCEIHKEVKMSHAERMSAESGFPIEIYHRTALELMNSPFYKKLIAQTGKHDNFISNTALGTKYCFSCKEQNESINNA